MRRILALFLMFHASFAWGAFEETAVVNGITWTYSSAEDGVKLGYHTTEPKMLTVTAINKSTSGSIVIPTTLNGRYVTQIGVAAFGGCSNLTSVTIPSGVKIIDTSAFAGCTKLKTITIPGSMKSIGDYAFSKCSSLTEIQMPNSVTNIGEGAFRKCSSLESVVFPSPLKNIPKSMFEDCVGLKSIDIPNGITNIGQLAFRDCIQLTTVTIADSVASIEQGAFSGCSSLKDVVIGSGVKYIGTAAFINCHSIENISLNDWTRLDIGAFRGCSKLRSIEIPSATSIIRDHTFCDCSNLVSVTALNASSIEEYAFANCINLKSVEINARKIGDKAFYCCSGLTNIVFSSQLSSIGAQAFSGCSGFADLLLPDGTKSIGKWAFRDCDNLKNVVIGKGLESFGSAPFYDCNSIEHLTIPQLICSIESNGVARLTSDFVASTPKSLTSIVVHEGVVSIANSTFGSCYSLRSVLIPESVVSIEPYAFYYCHYYYGLIDESHFSCDNLQTIYIPKNYKGSLPYLSLSVPSGLVECRYNPHQVVSLDANGGTVSPSSLTVNFASSYGNLPTPVRMGYDFSGWMYGGKCVNSSTSVAALDNHTLTAQWTPKNYQVSFDANGGVGGWSQAMEYGAAIEPPTVTREGYTFTGWSPSVLETVPMGDVAYSAQWAVNTYAVTFDANGGEGGWSQQMEYGTEIVPPSVAWDDYAFLGWTPSVAATVPASNVTYVAQWNHQPVFTIDENGALKKVDPREGTDIVIPDGVTSIGSRAFEKCKKITSVTIPEGVTSIGYEAFFGCNGLTSVTIPSSVTNIWRQAFAYCSGLKGVYISDIDAWLGITFGDEKSNPLYYAHNLYLNGALVTEVRIPDGYTKIGYALCGCSSITNITISSTVTNIGEYAFYGCSSLTDMVIPDSVMSIGSHAFDSCSALGFVSFGRGLMSIDSYAFRYCAPERIVFNGDAPTVGTPFLYGTAYVHLSASGFEIAPSEYTWNGLGIRYIEDVVNVVTFDANGGTGGWSRAMDYGAVITVPTVTHAGYTFVGWSPSVAATVPMGGASYTALWKANQYTVTFDANGGTGGKTVTQNYGMTLSAPTVTRTGYTFVGWSPAVPATIPAGNITYVAQWAKAKYMVTFNANGGTSGWSRSMEYGAAIVPPTVTRAGYTFVGWSPSVAATVPAGNVTYTAQWMVNQYTVAFDANGGIGGKTVMQDYGTTLSAPTVTRIGYTFVGWSPVVPVTVPAGNATYVAQWTANEYTVTFDANGGTSGWSRSMEYGAAIVPPTVTRAGYTFVGWTPSVAATVPVGGASYMAQWKVNQYTVTFDANGGTGGKTVTQNYGAALTATTVSRTGYAFKGWSPTVPATVPAGNATYVAQWQINKYTVTFNANGGTGGWSRSMEYGAAIMPPTVTRTGYTFIGWSSAVAGTVPAGNITYTAQWKVNQYTVTFDANGGEGGTPVTQDYGTSLVAPVVTRTGYTLAGWSPAVPVTVPAGNATYVAQWEINKYTTTFELHGGDGDGQIVVEHGTKVGELPVPTRTGHTFAGWFTAATGGEQVPDDEAITGDTTLYAQWAVNQYTVTFDENGGKGGMSVTQDYGTSLVAPVVTRTGYTLAGWSPAVPVTVPAINATYVAQWTANKYAVTFDANGGTGGWSGSMDYDATITAPTVTRTGYTFTGWSPVVAETVSIGGAYYTAQWTINRHKVSLSLNGGVGSDSVTVNYGTKVGDLPIPSRDGCEFAGWFTAAKGGRQIANHELVTADMTLYAQWIVTRPELNYDEVEGAAPTTASSVYDGYLVDALGNVKGTIQVKIGAPNKKTGLATASATVQVGAMNKKSLKGENKGKTVIASDGPTDIEFIGVEECVVRIGDYGMSGIYGAYEIDGSRNVFTSKNKSEASAAVTAIEKWIGTYIVMWDGGTASVTIDKRGKVKASVMLSSGAKGTATSQLLVGDEWMCVPVMVTKKMNVAFTFWLPADGGEAVVTGLGDDVVVGKTGTLKSGAKFRLDTDDAFWAKVLPNLMAEYLPNGVTVTQEGTKLVLPKAGKLTMKKGVLDDSKAGENPSGLKLTLKKDGTFSGTFKVYYIAGVKLKTETVNVSGVVINGIGYGVATVKKISGGVSISIDLD